MNFQVCQIVGLSITFWFLPLYPGDDCYFPSPSSSSSFFFSLSPSSSSLWLLDPLQGDPLYSVHTYKFLPPESLKSISSGLGASLVAVVASLGPQVQIKFEITPWLWHKGAVDTFPYNIEDHNLFFSHRNMGSCYNRSIL